MALGKECKERGRQLPANRNNSSQTGKCRTFAPSEAFLKSFFFFFFSEPVRGLLWFWLISPQLHRATGALPASSQPAPHALPSPWGVLRPDKLPLSHPWKGERFSGCFCLCCRAVFPIPVFVLPNYKPWAWGLPLYYCSIWLPPWKALLCSPCYSNRHDDYSYY